MCVFKTGWAARSNIHWDLSDCTSTSILIAKDSSRTLFDLTLRRVHILPLSSPLTHTHTHLPNSAPWSTYISQHQLLFARSKLGYIFKNIQLLPPISKSSQFSILFIFSILVLLKDSNWKNVNNWNTKKKYLFNFNEEKKPFQACSQFHTSYKDDNLLSNNVHALKICQILLILNLSIFHKLYIFNSKQYKIFIRESGE